MFLSLKIQPAVDAESPFVVRDDSHSSYESNGSDDARDYVG